MEFSGAIVIKYLCEHTGMSIEEVLVEHRVVIGQSLGESGEASGRYLAQRVLVSLEPNSTHIENYPVIQIGDSSVECLRVHHDSTDTADDERQ